MDVFLVVFFFFLFHSNDFILCTALINPERLARAAANTCFSDFVLFFKNSAVTLNFEESLFCFVPHAGTCMARVAQHTRLYGCCTCTAAVCNRPTGERTRANIAICSKGECEFQKSEIRMVIFKSKAAVKLRLFLE